MSVDRNDPVRRITPFKESEWQDSEKAESYLNQADVLIQERPMLLSLLRIFYVQMIKPRATARVLDLGCGDGILGETLKELEPEIKLTAWDGSEVMLNAAKKRLSSWSNVEFRQIDFNELIKSTDLKSTYDLVVSAFAIHHASHHEKRGLFAQIHQLLKSGGFFINIDTALANNASYDRFYDEIWRVWLRKQQEILNLDLSILELPEKAKVKPENKYEPISVQLCFLEEVGFQDVECFYKQGLFTMFGCRK
jgi:tRNA (cmo5U34)-methyltransferase